MGNCAYRGNGQPADSSMVRVVTSSGGVLELYPPVTAECVTNEFPSHGIFRSREAPSCPLLHNEELVGGQSYYLRPLSGPLLVVPSVPTPYRVSFDQHGFWRRQQDVEVWQNYYSSGVWKVKLFIKPDQLTEILSQESRTEALIESIRAVAKCGSRSSASVASSDQCSLSSSRKAISENMPLTRAMLLLGKENGDDR